MTTARVALECVALAGVLYVSCFAVGWWLWAFASRRLRSVSVWTGAPIAGLAVSMTVAYYWAGHGGLDAIAPWLLGFSVAIDVIVLVRRRREVRIDANAVRSFGWATAVAGGTSVLFLWHHIQILRIGRLSTGSLFLADLQSFMMIGDHFGRDGLAGPGSVVGFDLSALGAGTPGSGMFMSLASAWTGRPEFEASLPVALLCIVLIALAARDLARLMLPWFELFPAMLAVAAAGVSLVVYATAHYPLSQLLAMSASIAFLVVVADAALWARTHLSARRMVCAAIFLTPVVLSYPHMAVLGPPLLAGVALAAAVGYAWKRRLVSSIVTGLGGVAIVFIVLPGAVIETFRRVQQIADATAGFSLTLLTPGDLLGLRRSYVAYADGPNATAEFALEAVVITIVVALVVRFTRAKSRARAAFAGATALGTLSSYAMVFAVRGASYTQWKWASFMVPIFVVGTGSVLILGFVVATRALRPARRRIALGVVSAVLLAVVIGDGLVAQDATREFVAASNGHVAHRDWSLVTDDRISMASGPAYAGVRAVNVELQSYSDTAWAAYFLAPRTTYTASGAGVVSVPPLARWTLERHDRPFVHPPETDVRVVNATYRLVRERPDKVEPGTLWIVGDCDGLYRFDGKRWRGIERTPATGSFEISLTPRSVVPNTRVPLLARGEDKGVDALLLEYLPGGKARIVAEHFGVGSTARDRRLPRRPVFTYGKRFDLTPGVPVKLSAVFDPFTGEQRVERAGQALFDSRAVFMLSRAVEDDTAAGSNPDGLAAADRRFHGALEVAPGSTPLCDSLRTTANPG